MTDRKWWPKDYLDEMMPAGTRSPSDWIAGPYGDGYRIADPNDESDALASNIQPGAAVGFYWCERHDDVEVTFNRDGTFSADAPLPHGYNWCRVEGDQDTLYDSVEHLAVALSRADMSHYFDDGRKLNIEFATWADAEVPHRLVVIDGKPSFEVMQ